MCKCVLIYAFGSYVFQVVCGRATLLTSSCSGVTLSMFSLGEKFCAIEFLECGELFMVEFVEFYHVELAAIKLVDLSGGGCSHYAPP